MGRLIEQKQIRAKQPRLWYNVTSVNKHQGVIDALFAFGVELWECVEHEKSI